MMKTRDRIKLNISQEKSHGEKQAGDYIYGFAFPRYHGRTRYGDLNKRAHMTFYMKNLNGDVIYSCNIVEIWRNDHFFIHPRSEKSMPDEVKEDVERISIKFV